MSASHFAAAIASSPWAPSILPAGGATLPPSLVGEDTHAKESTVIYEIRTYAIAPGSLAEVEQRFGDAYESRKKYSPLTAFWHTEIGPLNEIIHVWGYNDLAERARIRAEAAKDG